LTEGTEPERPIFGFIMHPLDLEDVYDFEPGSIGKPIPLVKKVLGWMKESWEISSVIITSQTGQQVEARIQCVPRLPEQMIVDDDDIRELVLQAAKKLEADGAQIIGLGAYTAIVGDHGRMIEREVGVPVTSGNGFTVWTALEAAREAADQMKIEMSDARAVVIGATGSIGRVCAKQLQSEVKELVLVGHKNVDRLSKMAEAGDNISFSTDIKESLRGSDIVISASSDTGVIVEADWLKPGSVVCDIARPRDVAEEAAKTTGILVIEGGIVRLPGEPEWDSRFTTFNNLGLPPNLSYACFSETALRALEPDLRKNALGINVKEIKDLSKAAEKHGFEIAGLRNFDRTLTEEEMTRTRRKARMRVFSRMKHSRFVRKAGLSSESQEAGETVS